MEASQTNEPQVQEAPKPKVKRTSLMEYSKNERIFVKNRSNKPTPDGRPTQEFGDLNIPVRKENGVETLPLVIPKTYLPIELTQMFSLKELRGEHRVSSLIGNGILELVDQEDALREIQSPAGQVERARLDRWMHGNRTSEDDKLRQGSPIDASIVKQGGLASGNNTVLDIALTLIENVQKGTVPEENGISVMQGLVGTYTSPQLQELLNNPGVTLQSIRDLIRNSLRQRGDVL